MPVLRDRLPLSASPSYPNLQIIHSAERNSAFVNPNPFEPNAVVIVLRLESKVLQPGLRRSVSSVGRRGNSILFLGKVDLNPVPDLLALVVVGGNKGGQYQRFQLRVVHIALILATAPRVPVPQGSKSIVCAPHDYKGHPLIVAPGRRGQVSGMLLQLDLRIYA